ncbi:glycosyltransferase [Rhodococcus sp. 05-2255-3C]|nr:glycosyltransferase [Rhodococcus sp. 05-2255-3C]
MSALSRLLFYIAEQMQSIRKQTVAAVSPHELYVATSLIGRPQGHYLPNVSRAKDSSINYLHGNSGAFKPRIISVGRISAQKGPGFLAECARRTAGQYSWTWVGDGTRELRAELEEADVHVTGWIPNEQVWKEIAEADLFVHAALWEGAPITLVDSIRLGTPVIARTSRQLDGLGYYQGGKTPAELVHSVNEFFTNADIRHRVLSISSQAAAIRTAEAQHDAIRKLYTFHRRENSASEDIHAEPNR